MKTNKEMIINRARNFAIKEYGDRQRRTFDGDPTGFSVIYNGRSDKFTCLALGSKKLRELPKSSLHIANVYSNGSFEEEENLPEKMDFVDLMYSYAGGSVKVVSNRLRMVNGDYDKVATIENNTGKIKWYSDYRINSINRNSDNHPIFNGVVRQVVENLSQREKTK